MQLTPGQRTFLVRDQIVGAALVNFAFNALIGWLAFRKSPEVSVWGDPGLVLDLSGTALILAVLVVLITTPLVRRAVQTGQVGSLVEPMHALVRWLPRNLLLRASLLGVVALAVTVPALTLCMRLVGLEQVSLTTFVLCKATLAAAWAAILAPTATLYVLAAPRTASVSVA